MKLLKLSAIAMAAAFVFILGACGQQEQGGNELAARATLELSRVYINEEAVDPADTDYEGATLTFVGEEQGGNVLFQIGGETAQASINPSREHPSFESGYWHHHLYAASTAAGSERINFMELFPGLGIDDNPEATDNTQSSYQRGNLHYVVADGEFRLRFTIDGVTHDLLFTEV
ncbi:MAG: hypothetical protein FWF59_09495 [Turicibacter sp.]|nr:hypothetical protein [Turicibacter sp.]